MLYIKKQQRFCRVEFEPTKENFLLTKIQLKIPKLNNGVMEGPWIGDYVTPAEYDFLKNGENTFDDCYLNKARFRDDGRFTINKSFVFFGSQSGNCSIKFSFLHSTYLRDCNVSDSFLYEVNAAKCRIRDSHIEKVTIPAEAKIINGYITQPRHVLVLNPVGSDDAPLTAYRNKHNRLDITRGCFYGDLKSFVHAVKETHGRSKIGREYQSVIRFLREWFPITKDGEFKTSLPKGIFNPRPTITLVDSKGIPLTPNKQLEE